MRANYEVYECPGTWESDTVAHVTIDVCDDPTHLDNCIDAIKAAGYDPYERCSRGCGPAYNARFVGYANGNTTENTPKHCHGCHQFANCRQAQNMMADTPPVEGWVYDGEVFCADYCGGGDNGTPYEGPSDYPVHCSGCGVPIIHELTQEGIDYVRESLADDGGCCRELWPTVWGIIPVDSIVIPARFVQLCEGWYGGQDCMLYAVSSTGNLTIGTRRPRGCDSDEKWYLTIWRDLAADVWRARCAAGNEHAYPEGHEDIDALVGFEFWVDEQVERLERSYGLANWDASDD